MMLLFKQENKNKNQKQKKRVCPYTDKFKVLEIRFTETVHGLWNNLNLINAAVNQ